MTRAHLCNVKPKPAHFARNSISLGLGHGLCNLAGIRQIVNGSSHLDNISEKDLLVARICISFLEEILIFAQVAGSSRRFLICSRPPSNVGIRISWAV